MRHDIHEIHDIGSMAILAGPGSPQFTPRAQIQEDNGTGPRCDATTRTYYAHSSGLRVNTDAAIVPAITAQHPSLSLTIVPVRYNTICDLLAYAVAGFASATLLDETALCPLKWRIYLPPARRLDGGDGGVGDKILFGKFEYTYKDRTYIMYVSSGRDGMNNFPDVTNQYLLGPPGEVAAAAVDDLVRAAAQWSIELHEEVWVFDGGFWDKSKELYNSVEKASWDDVILDADMKKAIQDDVLRFFESRERYDKLKVPWKRGIIYYGPPGNGKTVSTKAMMRTLYHLPKPVPTLYVRTLTSFAGPEYSISAIFSLARREAPCLLVFEDLDSIVSDEVRSYFLNEVDGLQTNEGVLMIGSTNHLDRLDPGISKRPSRFDRKYEFPKPDLDERVAYSEYWRGKLKDNEDIEFPRKLSTAVAEITDGFSFAYIQEAFIAALLTIAAGEEVELSGDAVGKGKGKDKHEHKDLDGLILWRELKKQIKILRDEL